MLPMGEKKGFSLLEMAIVIVIIAVLIGCIFVGRSMVRAAQLRGMVAEYDMYAKAIKEFQDKYTSLPGDMNNAVTIWGSATANGDGSGTIGTSDTGGNVTDTAGSGGLGNSTEWFLLWQHLTLAGFLEGSYSGVHGAGGAKEALVGTNVPASQVTGAGWTLTYYLNNSSNATGLWPDQYGHLLNLGGYLAGDYTKAAVLTPVEAYSMDTKLDDGAPGTGRIRAWRASVLPSCTDETNGVHSTQTSAIYQSTLTTKSCALVFLLGF